jgi:hypothetical protein
MRLRLHRARSTGRKYKELKEIKEVRLKTGPEKENTKGRVMEAAP